MALRTLGVEVVEIVDAELRIRLALAQHVVDDDEQAVRDCYSRFLGSMSASNAAELRVEVRGAGPDAGPSNLTHDRAQPYVAMVGWCLHSFAGALLVAGA